MTSNDDKFARDVLSRFVPPRRRIAPDWDNVVQRSNFVDVADRLRRPTGRIPRRQPADLRRVSLRRGFAVGFAVIAAMVCATLAISAENNWWFFYDGSPAATSDVLVVAAGTWDSHDWTLTAYQTKEFGVCFALTPGTGPAGRGGSMTCAPRSFPSPGSTPVEERMMTSGVSGGGAELPTNVFGVTSDQVSRVQIAFTDGDRVDIPTIDPPAALGAPKLHFFATPLHGGVTVTQVMGIDSQGNVIARNDFTSLLK
jgi:hypothetical protein